MDLTDIDTLKSLLSRFRIRPSESLGQNFLVDPNALETILEAAELRSSDTVIEIGAGLGTLTSALAKRVRQVLAVEKDRRLVPALRFVLKKFQNVEIIDGDFLKLDIQGLLAASHSKSASFKVVANIPYYITGKILENLLALPQKPEAIVLLVQKEVGERVCAVPGGMSKLSVSVQFYSRPGLIAKIPRQSFFPPPEVVSAVLKLVPYAAPVLETDEKLFFRLVKIGFAQRRKTLENNLAAGLHMTKAAATRLLTTAGLKPSARAQELSLEDWARLLAVSGSEER